MLNSSAFLQLIKDSGLPLPVMEYKFHTERRWRLDYAWTDERLALEVEGGVWIYGRHNRPKTYLKEMDKYNALCVMGWRLLRVTPKELLTIATIEMIREALTTT